MEIQKILFPKIGRCTEEELYFRNGNIEKPEKHPDWLVENLSKTMTKVIAQMASAKIHYNREEEVLCIKQGGKVKFDTYFNGFSIEKWKKYTVIDNVSVKLKISGKVAVTLMCKEKIHNDVIEKVISETIVESKEPAEFSFSFQGGNGKGMYCFSIEALSEECKFYGGSYTTEVSADKIRNVKIGIAICTFRREEFIEKNVGILKEAILENKDCPMNGHLEVFIADNGKTLDIPRLSSPAIHINPNRNLGGAGGFTRDLIEMMQHNDELKLTHALLMDDDIVIEPEALIKTFVILSLLKEEYKDAFVGGAMLRLDKQYMQVESGASWNGGYLQSLKTNLDLRSCDSCLFNEVEEHREFNAWWYCCFPMNVVSETNLPLPIFIRGDDVEYGLRNMKHLILMNGICVWHEPFENKYSSFLEYYIMRNQLIDNAFHCQWFNAKHVKKNIATHCKQEIMYYRYKNVDLYTKGIRDFLKGPEWLMKQDGEALHQEVMAAGYKAQDLENLPMSFSYPLYEANYNIVDTPKARYKRILTLNGLFLKSSGESIVPMAMPKSIMFYRKKRVMHYDVTARKAFITEKSYKESLRCIFKTMALMWDVTFKLKKAQKAYRTEGMKLRTLEFWNEFLGLK